MKCIPNSKSLFLCAVLIGCFYLSSCTGTETGKEQAASGSMSETPSDSLNQPDDSLLCFRNESLTPAGTSDKDIDELKIHFQHGVVDGEYNWLPKHKDQRKGQFEGVLKDSVIHASYIFLQEGVSDTSDIKIILNANEAIVEGGSPGLGLSKTLKKVSCE